MTVPFIFGFGQATVVSDMNDTITTAPDVIMALQDSTTLLQDTAKIQAEQADSLLQSTSKSSNKLDSQIIYASKDSIVFWKNGTGFLHGDGDVKYKNITLNADYIRVKMDSSLLYAKGTTDSIGDVIGEPVFGEGTSVYNSKEITYNLQTGKGYVLNAVTQQGEGYIVSERTKKTGEDLVDVAGAKFTTCDDHDHPHFYLRIAEGKVKPGSHIVSGKAQLYLVDVPLPLIIPFGFFPFTDQYSSGLLMPSVADELNRGLGLINGGYYFAINDYVDLQLLGDIYTKGTWAVRAESSYLKRYKYNGNLSFSYREDVTGEKDMPDYQKAKNMNILWNHSQDTKANPYQTFSASVNFSTSGYDRNNINNYNQLDIASQNQKMSSINFTQRFPKIPQLNISAAIRLSQETRDSTIDLTLPDISISYSRFYPLKRKNAVGKERWYEKISMGYSGSLRNGIRTKENQLFSSNFLRDWKTGFTHNIPIQASFNLLNYITVTPSFTYSERWNLSSIRKNWNSNIQEEVVDTITGFHRNFDFRTSLTMQTKLYGFYIPIRSIFGDKIDRIRHVLTPSISFNYNPDFTDPKWGFFDEYIRTDIAGRMDTIRYDIYDGIGVGGPGRMGRRGSLDFSLGNNIEMKLRNDRDTTGSEPFKIISLIDDLRIGSGYNFMADSLNLSNISVSLKLKLGKSKTLSLQTSFDPYMLERRGDNKVYKINEFTWNHGLFPRFMGTTASYSIGLNNATFKKIGQWLKGENVQLGDEEESNISLTEQNKQLDDQGQGNQTKSSSKKKAKESLDNEGYTKLEIPWNFNVTYTASIHPSGDINDFIEEKSRFKMKTNHTLNFSGNVSLTQNWKFDGALYYDITEKKVMQVNFNVTRNLHCWSMSARIVPFGVYKSYHFHIGVNANMLKDLKYEKRNNRSAANIQWY